MIDVVVVYDRSTASLLEQEIYTDEMPKAFAKRLELERAYRKRGDVEVVLLSANDVNDLKVSHARYFDPMSIGPEALKNVSDRLLNRAS